MKTQLQRKETAAPVPSVLPAPRGFGEIAVPRTTSTVLGPIQRSTSNANMNFGHDDDDDQEERKRPTGKQKLVEEDDVDDESEWDKEEGFTGKGAERLNGAILRGLNLSPDLITVANHLGVPLPKVSPHGKKGTGTGGASRHQTRNAGIANRFRDAVEQAYKSKTGVIHPPAKMVKELGLGTSSNSNYGSNSNSNYGSNSNRNSNSLRNNEDQQRIIDQRNREKEQQKAREKREKFKEAQKQEYAPSFMTNINNNNNSGASSSKKGKKDKKDKKK